MKKLVFIITVSTFCILSALFLSNFTNIANGASENSAKVKWVPLVATESADELTDKNTYASEPSLKLDEAGNPIIAWSNGLSGDIFIKRWNGKEWIEIGEGSASGGGISKTKKASTPSLALDPKGNPIVAWSDDSSGKSEIYIKRWDGSAWVEVGAGSAAGGGISNSPKNSDLPSLAVDSAGNPQIAWADNSSGKFQIYIKRWDGENWVEIGQGSAAGKGISNTKAASHSPSLVVDSSENPIVAWFSGSLVSSGDIYILRWDGSTWNEMGKGSGSGKPIIRNAAPCQSLVLDRSGKAVLAWADGTSPNVKIMVKRWDENAWVQIGERSPHSIPGISLFMKPSLAFDSSNNPIVAWINMIYTPITVLQPNPLKNQSVFVMKWDGSNWVEMGSGSASGRGILKDYSNSNHPVIVTDKDGNPVVAWESHILTNSTIVVRRYEP